MLDLKNITLALVDGVDPHKSLKVLTHCSRLADFNEILFFTFQDVEAPANIRLIKIQKLDYLGYNNFIISKLNSYINSDFCLIVQTDGFILNPSRWRKEFLDFDYIGAPWPSSLQQKFPNGTRVGNGGFSLRSKKFLEATSKNISDYLENTNAGENMGNEDFVVCKVNYEKLTAEGIKFADLKTASEFSVEAPIPEHPKSLNDTFGFHGKQYMHLVNKILK